MSIQELHNILVSDPVYGGLKEARDVENNIIIIDSTLHSLLPPYQKNVNTIQGHMRLLMFAYLPRVYIPRLYHGVIGK